MGHIVYPIVKSLQESVNTFKVRRSLVALKSKALYRRQLRHFERVPQLGNSKYASRWLRIGVRFIALENLSAGLGNLSEAEADRNCGVDNVVEPDSGGCLQDVPILPSVLPELSYGS
ncbi:MAG TPA: hypothetical protein VN822_09205 [Candidatus Acidoferrales bacterium]|nr:hypothetical protein [Candidatus Acidoferrales bacterium]